MVADKSLMNQGAIKEFLTPKYIVALVAIIALAVLVVTKGSSSTYVFFVACLALVPLAGIIGQSTEMLAERTGPKVGGFLNATLGNAAELIIAFVALKNGYITLAKASIIGSAVGNLLLVLGLAMLMGGLRHGRQQLDKESAKHYATMLITVVILFSIPTIAKYTGGVSRSGLHTISLGLAIGMLLVYAMGMYYTFKTSAAPLARRSAEGGHKIWSVAKAGAILAVSTILVVVISEILVSSIKPVLKSFPGMGVFFVGFIIIPIVGNVAEHFVAVQVSHKNNDMSLSMEVAVGSSLQILLLVAPLLVIAGLLMGKRLDLTFNLIEWAALIGSCVIVSRVSSDGETNYFEGGTLVILYAMIAWVFYVM